MTDPHDSEVGKTCGSKFIHLSDTILLSKMLVIDSNLSHVISEVIFWDLDRGEFYTFSNFNVFPLLFISKSVNITLVDSFFIDLSTKKTQERLKSS